MPESIFDAIVRKIKSNHDWFDLLEILSPQIKKLDLKKRHERKEYFDQSNNKIIPAYSDAYNIANSSNHNQKIVKAVEAVFKARPDAIDIAIKLLGDLASRKTYGTFCEMAVYAWLDQVGMPFMPQVELSASEVLNGNGSTLDARVDYIPQKPFYLDIKGFGFHERQIEKLQEEINRYFIGESVLIEGEWDGSISLRQDLFSKKCLDALVAELRERKSARRGPLQFRLQQPNLVTISAHTTNPRQSTQNNREYVLNYASQFVKIAPFVLVFAIHPWFGRGGLHQNFQGSTDLVAEELAYQTFFGFKKDIALECGVPRHDVVKHLSAIMFLSVWPEAMSQKTGTTCRIYLNNEAHHLISCNDLFPIYTALGENIVIKDLFDVGP